jgi:preprotein translocase subunit SecE
VSESAAEAPSEGRASRSSTAPRTRDAGARRGLFARIALFWRQVVAELKKVVWPTRQELSTYVVVVLVFVVIVMAFITVVDVGVGQLMLWIFGGGSGSAG